ncbi:cytochrome c biogenesis protein CcmG, thiol:disulfide interchange protein DsbE [Marinospirillum celere]|uniref:Cytochrome c biogenesis protein CcmG, thiol:disulfide interchange protein DsbE n=1 Tax=Marinospirillum celere TaxID=1122252 RepID=A0A1I1GYX7_9GAMM|nr:DsbE family thiol:disulfide interchange protein [Marinospirillum celere]SFC16864.1 cytochrome c biogenesis protein CcmG, thiol:disulfide interchange protein DsbE [Marinospirillum celere]
MKRALLFLPLIIFMGLGVFLYKGLGMDPSARESALLNKPLPEFSMPRLDNEELKVTRDDLLGEVFLINVWGSWCPACYEEHDEILRLAKEGVPVVGLNYKDERPKAFRYLSQLGNPYTVNLYEPDGVRALAFDLGVYGAPETFLIDKEGIVRYHVSGEITARMVDEVILPEVRKWQNAY